jgi:hypothetical protein
MANPKESATVNLGDKITLDQLISSTSASVLRALREQETAERFPINPKIWVGIWIDLERFRFPGGPATGPGGGPGGGGIG